MDPYLIFSFSGNQVEQKQTLFLFVNYCMICFVLFVFFGGLGYERGGWRVQHKILRCFTCTVLCMQLVFDRNQ